MKLRLFEAFAGVGSQRMALRNIGADFESVGIMEVDRYALLSYCAIHEGFDYEGALPSDDEIREYLSRINVGYDFSSSTSQIPTEHEDLVKLYVASVKSKNYGDIRKVDADSMPDMDFFTYSFPCKDFSIAGVHRGGEKGSGTKSALMWECERIIRTKRPKYLMMENVPGMIYGKNSVVLHTWKKILRDMGYVNYAKVLQGRDFGVPQKRERLIMFSVLGGSDFDFVQSFGSRNGILRDIMVEGKVDDSYYLYDKGYEITKVDLKGSVRNTLFDEDKSLIMCGKTSAKFEQDQRIYHPNGACPTICASTDVGTTRKKWQKGMKLWDDYGPRMFVPIELWRAQGYSDVDFHKAEALNMPENRLCERAGRGIVIPMLEAQYRRLFKDYLKGVGL